MSPEAGPLDPHSFVRPEYYQFYEDLRRGVCDRADPVTWRTLSIGLRTILGSQEPENQVAPMDTFYQGASLLMGLTEGTYLEILYPEILYSLYGEDSLPLVQEGLCPIDVLCINGRHFPEPLLYDLADAAAARNLQTAVLNPVGHFNDQETRIILPGCLLRPAKEAVILASTQASRKLNLEGLRPRLREILESETGLIGQLTALDETLTEVATQAAGGGGFTVLEDVIRGVLRNPEFSSQVEKLMIVIPMFGGSRGHKPGQDNTLGYEVLEAIDRAKGMGLQIVDIKKQLRAASSYRIPQINVLSVDIHNAGRPALTYQEYGIPFNSLDTAPCFAQVSADYLFETGNAGLPLVLTVFDKGAIPRMEAYAGALLQALVEKLPGPGLMMIYFDKKRISAGKIAGMKVDHVCLWKLEDEGIKVKEIWQGDGWSTDQECVVLSFDDMFDTCGTAGRNLSWVKAEQCPRARLVLCAATHGVLSKGISALDRVPADHFFIGNTLKIEGLDSRQNITQVNLGPVILEGILQE
ncbi:MAG: ribose-phosphate pyrophosphokinase [Candidatus Pacebacteria bacterium]|nr:ribose-phosphate pyrophosphokinase [Candidatus Paceibacterota bacterium]